MSILKSRLNYYVANNIINKLSVKKLLTFEGCALPAVQRCQVSNSAEDVVNPKFINRNPRNLEQMNLATKEDGWKFHYPSKQFFYKLHFESSSKHTIASVEHCTNGIVLTASTKEVAISKHLYSNADVSAAENVGRVLAQRCLESGLTTMAVHEDFLSSESTKVTKFLDAIQECGIELQEPETILPEYEPGIDYDNEEEVSNLHQRQIMAGTRGPVTEYFYRLRKRQRLAAKRRIKIVAPAIERPSE